jgi:hypothetical protein
MLIEALPVRAGALRIVLGGLDEDGVGRAGDRAQLAANAALETVLVPRQDVESPEAREHLQLLVRVLNRERLLEQIFERNAETGGQLLDHALSLPSRWK